MTNIPTGKVAGKPTVFPIPPCTPFPRSSDFAKLFAILYAHRKTGIRRGVLCEFYCQWTLKDINKANHDLSPFVSKGTADGWIVEEKGFFTMIFDEKSQKLGNASAKTAVAHRKRPSVAKA